MKKKKRREENTVAKCEYMEYTEYTSQYHCVHFFFFIFSHFFRIATFHMHELANICYLAFFITYNTSFSKAGMFRAAIKGSQRELT